MVETGSITETARRLGRTQPAITLQLQRLEELTGKQLFEHGGRRLILTDDGTTVLTYAKSILRLHDELISQLASQEIEGQVVLGTPDLYAAFMLPRSSACSENHFRACRSSSTARCRRRWSASSSAAMSTSRSSPA